MIFALLKPHTDVVVVELVFQKESALMLQDVAYAFDLVVIGTHKTAAMLMRTIHLQINTLFV